jgi:hypothetical protein
MSVDKFLAALELPVAEFEDLVLLLSHRCVVLY